MPQKSKIQQKAWKYSESHWSAVSISLNKLGSDTSEGAAARVCELMDRADELTNRVHELTNRIHELTEYMSSLTEYMNSRVHELTHRAGEITG